MSDLGTVLDRTASAGAEGRAAAARYLTRSGNADLLGVLGLADIAAPLTRIDPRDAAMAKAYAEGATTWELAERFGVSQYTARRAVIRGGGVMRTRGGPRAAS